MTRRLFHNNAIIAPVAMKGVCVWGEGEGLFRAYTYLKTITLTMRPKTSYPVHGLVTRDVMVAESHAATYDDRSDSEYCNVLFAKKFTFCRHYIDIIYK